MAVVYVSGWIHIRELSGNEAVCLLRSPWRHAYRKLNELLKILFTCTANIPRPYLVNVEQILIANLACLTDHILINCDDEDAFRFISKEHFDGLQKI